ncbi:MAG: NUDIX hydrolase [Cycloclasticus sp.]|nr:NUDIX hydrolase [Cycloclasticus sp.]MBG96200.1 NUDIX hydrolase [Cycloclasticus sp.]HAI97575.1 NUDIX hydrolase [Methylococcaceae bacterium]|tara:strand:+ start:2390 stop:2932 length:543 start_codon:yes stop_codon:yes gene_type:complete
MKFCPQCGNKTVSLIPEGDNRVRDVCDSCDLIHYQNPRIIAGCIPVWEDKVLLCQRAIHPQKGFWTLPAGFMELAETTEQAAIRETLEEAEALVQTEELYAVFNLPHINQVYMMYRSVLLKPEFSSGIESLDVRLFAEHEIPWGDLAFETMRLSLEYYFQDRKAGTFKFRSTDINKPLLQ